MLPKDPDRVAEYRQKRREIALRMTSEQRANQRKAATKHGLSQHPLYSVWMSMIGRCCEPDDIAYAYYGARGISVCDEWRHDIRAFYSWAIANGYERGLEIDRKDNDGNYCPENCRWVTHAVNMQSRRPFSVEGRKHMSEARRRRGN